MTAAHLQQHTFTELTLYGDHADRTASAEFERNRRQLIKQLKLGCFICDSPGSPEHPLEAHHIHEWALWPSLDPARVLDTLHVFDPYGLTHQLGDKAVASPDDIRNLIILCSYHEIDGVPVPGGHHRGLECGVHDLTFPIWVAQRSVRPGISITSAVQEIKAKDKAIAAKAIADHAAADSAARDVGLNPSPALPPGRPSPPPI